MDNIIYLGNLYDYYENLLTFKQRQYFKDYYFKNLSLKEISENNNVSRNAVYKQIKEAVNKLNYYEKNLNLYEKSIKIKELIKDLKEKEEIEKLI